MRSLVIDVINSYEEKIATVEELLTRAYAATTGSDGVLSDLAKERENLKSVLREMLVRNCCVRRKDFDIWMQGILPDLGSIEGEVVKERQHVRDKLGQYLKEQRDMASALRHQLAEFGAETADVADIQSIAGKLKDGSNGRRDELIALLRNHEEQLQSIRMEQGETNGQLRKLVAKGSSLRVEDLKQLQRGDGRKARVADRQLRQHEVARLLAHFRQGRHAQDGG
jgi:hypothetical protein